MRFRTSWRMAAVLVAMLVSGWAGAADAPDPAPGRRPAVRIDHPEELPFATQSLDLYARSCEKPYLQRHRQGRTLPQVGQAAAGHHAPT